MNSIVPCRKFRPFNEFRANSYSRCDTDAAIEWHDDDQTGKVTYLSYRISAQLQLSSRRRSFPMMITLELALGSIPGGSQSCTNFPMASITPTVKPVLASIVPSVSPIKWSMRVASHDHDVLNNGARDRCRFQVRLSRLQPGRLNSTSCQDARCQR